MGKLGYTWRAKEKDALCGTGQAALSKESRLLERQLHHLPQYILCLAQRSHLQPT